MGRRWGPGGICGPAGLAGDGRFTAQGSPTTGRGEGGTGKDREEGEGGELTLAGYSSLPSLVLGGLTYATSLMLIESFEIISAIIPPPMEMRKQRFRDRRREILFGAV